MTVPDTGPQFPADRTGVAILGGGTIAQSRPPAGVRSSTASASPASGAGRRRRPQESASGSPSSAASTRAPSELLADPEVRFVDLATGPEGRLEWIEAAVDAGKHVLAQKPLTSRPPTCRGCRTCWRRAEAAGVRVAVNHNGRWAPPWRAGHPAAAAGRDRRGRRGHPPARQAAAAAGRHAVRRRAAHAAHRLPPALGRHHPHLARATSDDASGPPTPACPAQPDDARNPWSATLSMSAVTGATRTLRIVGNVVSSEPGCPFWVHGTDRHAARQRAARLRPARARRRRASARPCRCRARGSSTASRRRWAS